MEKRHLLSIDFMRFLAAGSVAYYHLGFKAFANSNEKLYHLTSHHLKMDGHVRLSEFGWIGVQIFFVISGFVIAYSAQGEGLKSYARRRILRLVPAVWIIVPFCLLISFVFFHEPLQASVVASLRTVAFVPAGPWILGQFWTIPVEVTFYICVGVLIGIKHTDWLEPFGNLLAVISSIYWISDALVHFSSKGQGLLQLFLVQHGIFFAIGISIYKISVSGPTWTRILFLATCCIPAFLQISWASQWEAIGVDPVLRSWLAFIIWLVLTALILISVVWKGKPQNHRVIRTIKILGLATYPLYLLHYHLGGVVLISTLAIGFPPAAAVLFALLASVSTAIFVASYAEPKLREGLSRLARGFGLPPSQGHSAR